MIATKIIAAFTAGGMALGVLLGGWLATAKSAAEIERTKTAMAQMQRDAETERKEAAEALATANAAALAKTQQMQQEIAHAQQNHAQALQRAQADAAAANRAAGSLRRELATTRASLSELSRHAIDSYASAATDVFGECAQRYGDLAARADQCTADLGLMREAWPK